jgi:hypothetical protein
MVVGGGVNVTPPYRTEVKAHMQLMRQHIMGHEQAPGLAGL